MPRGSPSCIKISNSLDKSEGNVNVDNRGHGNEFLSAILKRNIIQTRDSDWGEHNILGGKEGRID
jgi:hypothetical protein